MFGASVSCLKTDCGLLYFPDTKRTPQEQYRETRNVFLLLFIYIGVCCHIFVH